MIKISRSSLQQAIVCMIAFGVESAACWPDFSMKLLGMALLSGHDSQIALT